MVTKKKCLFITPMGVSIKIGDKTLIPNTKTVINARTSEVFAAINAGIRVWEVNDNGDKIKLDRFNFNKINFPVGTTTFEEEKEEVVDTTTEEETVEETVDEKEETSSDEIEDEPEEENSQQEDPEDKYFENAEPVDVDTIDDGTTGTDSFDDEDFEDDEE